MSLRALCLGGLLAVASLTLAQPPTVDTTPIRDGLYLLKGRGGNVLASIGPDGVLLVDSDYGNYQPAYLEALDALDADGVRFLVNTHWHGDHSGSNAAWGATGSVILAHDNVRQRLSTRQENKLFKRVTEPSPVSAWPLVTYGDSVALHVNGQTVELQHYPSGHTDGDSVVYFAEADVVHMGDHFFKDRFPFVDMSSGGTVDGFIDNVGAVLQRVGDDTTIVPGHGDLATRADLQRYHEMLVETRAEVQAMLDRGMDLGAITRQGLSDRWESWGAGFINEERWISFLAASAR
jgi:glyoxylase-like metal-dependent hydrolase (beta-lactamase superfamily II)